MHACVWVGVILAISLVRRYCGMDKNGMNRSGIITTCTALVTCTSTQWFMIRTVRCGQPVPSQKVPYGNHYFRPRSRIVLLRCVLGVGYWAGGVR